MRILEMNGKITKIKSLMEGLKERLDTEEELGHVDLNKQAEWGTG